MQRQRVVAVRGQHERPDRDLTGQGLAVNRSRPALGRHVLGDTGQRADPGGQPQHAGDVLVDHPGPDGAVAHGGDQPAAPGTAPRGHDDVQAAVRRAGGVMRSHPIRDNDAVEAPLVAEHAELEGAVGGHRHPVDGIVGGHDSPRAGVPHEGLERRQV
jgi:hypothetical protein